MSSLFSGPASPEAGFGARFVLVVFVGAAFVVFGVFVVFVLFSDMSIASSCHETNLNRIRSLTQV
jgi:hypothetical protein